MEVEAANPDHLERLRQHKQGLVQEVQSFEADLPQGAGTDALVAVALPDDPLLPGFLGELLLKGN